MADLEVKDFKGGMTDAFIGGPSDKGQLFDNLVIIQADTVAKPESRLGSEIYDEDNYLLPPSVSYDKRVDSIYRFKDDNIFQTENLMYHVPTTTWASITGPTGNAPFTTSAVEFNQNSYTEWNNHLIVTNDSRQYPVYIYRDGTAFRLRTVGLPSVNVGSIAYSTSGAGTSRRYALVYAYTYTIDGVEFTQRGAVANVSAAHTGTIPNTVSGIPTLSNGATGNYDTTNIKVEIYRTADAGSVYYKVGEVTNGTATFNDTTADASLTAGILLYTESDDLDYDRPPKCKYVVQLNGIVYYLNIEDSAGDVYPYRLVQAAPDQIYAANEGNVLDLDGDITGAGIAGQNVIVFTDKKTYRLEGFYDSTGRGGISKVEISNTSGCVSHKSIVQTLDGCYFAAKDGFYYTNGYKCIRVSENVSNSYKQLVESVAQAKRIYGTYDTVNKRIMWAVTQDSSLTDNEMIYCCHLDWGISPNMPFTRWNGGYWTSNFTPTAILFYDNLVIRGDTRGYILKHREDVFNDIKIDTTTTPDNWTNLPVIYDYRSCAYDFNDNKNRKWVTKIVAYADSWAKVAFTIFSNNDNTGVFNELAEIKSSTPISWGDNDVIWGDSDIRWNYVPLVNGIRRFPSGGLRCSYKQIKITNSYTQIDSSTVAGNVSTNSTSKQITLLDSAYAWDTNAVDYYLSFSDDSYETEYKIITRNSDTVVTVLDSNNTLQTSAGMGFKLKGYRKNEAIRLLSYTIMYQTLSPTQTPYRGA